MPFEKLDTGIRLVGGLNPCSLVGRSLTMCFQFTTESPIDQMECIILDESPPLHLYGALVETFASVKGELSAKEDRKNGICGQGIG